MTRPARFEGVIARTHTESTPWFDEPPHPGEQAPNVVIVLLDDTGFAQFGCYGSDVDTPNVGALAANGGPPMEVLTYPRAGHSFFNHARPTFDRNAKQLAVERIEALLAGL